MLSIETSSTNEPMPPEPTPLPSGITNIALFDIALELARFRETLESLTHRSGRYLAKLPKGALRTEHVPLHEQLLALEAKFKVSNQNAQNALHPFNSIKPPQS